MVTAREVARALPGSENDACYCIGPIRPGFCRCVAWRKHNVGPRVGGA